MNTKFIMLLICVFCCSSCSNERNDFGEKRNIEESYDVLYQKLEEYNHRIWLLTLRFKQEKDSGVGLNLFYAVMQQVRSWGVRLDRLAL